MSRVLNNTEEIRAWLRACPALSSASRFRVNYLGEAATEYALYSVPTTLSYKENVLGEYIPENTQALNFVFASKEEYGADVQTNLASLGFYDEVVAWIIKQNAVRNFPEIADGKVISVVPTLTAYPSEVGSNYAKYQIQLKLTYRRK